MGMEINEKKATRKDRHKVIREELEEEKYAGISLKKKKKERKKDAKIAF